jgi:hypothetical protein
LPAPNAATASLADDETDMVTDIRHGFIAGFGNRWLLFDQTLTINLGASITTNFKRTLEIDSKNPNAKTDYEHMIADLPDTRMSVRPLPEADLGIGYAW